MAIEILEFSIESDQQHHRNFGGSMIMIMIYFQIMKPTIQKIVDTYHSY